MRAVVLMERVRCSGRMLLPVAFVLSACESLVFAPPDGEMPPPPDGAMEAGADVRVDTGMDVVLDTGVDVHIDAGVDAAMDTGVDVPAPTCTMGMGYCFGHTTCQNIPQAGQPCCGPACTGTMICAPSNTMGTGPLGCVSCGSTGNPCCPPDGGSAPYCLDGGTCTSMSGGGMVCH